MQQQNFFRLALLQLTSTSNYIENFEKIKCLIKEASDQRAQIAFLPEGFAHIGKKNQDNIQTLKSGIFQNYQSLAVEHNIWLSLGGFLHKVEEDQKHFNSHIIINNSGEIVSVYDKIHLFNLNYDGENTMNESNTVEFGQSMPEVVQSPIGKLGLSICYDLRFPEIYRVLAQSGAEILTVPSAFMQVTGKSHWHCLLRTRAIENQCFVIAAAQVGKHNENRVSYGHSVVIDPWGDVIHDMGSQKVGVDIVDIDLDDIQRVRRKLPAQNNIRHDLYEIIYKIKKAKL